MSDPFKGRGKSGFEGLLWDLGDLFHQAANVSADMRKENGNGEKPKPVFEQRFTVRTMDGEDVGNNFFKDLFDLVSHPRGREEGKDPADNPPEAREPKVEILAGGGEVEAVVELPGIEPTTLVVRLDEDMLTITASGPGVEYKAEALLPCTVDDTKREFSFSNGVLELRWPQPEAKP
jgi:HSP20 family molecular chaperone IbpA